MLEEMDQPPFTVNIEQRKAVHNAITELRQLKSYLLGALNVRTNHVVEAAVNYVVYRHGDESSEEWLR